MKARAISDWFYSFYVVIKKSIFYDLPPFIVIVNSKIMKRLDLEKWRRVLTQWCEQAQREKEQGNKHSWVVGHNLVTEQ